MFPWFKRVVLGSGLVFIGLVLLVFLALRPPRFEIPAPTRIEYVGVTVHNPGEPPLVGQRVVIEDGKIVEISPAADGPERGKVLLPGLIDNHVHVSLLSDHAGLLLLRHGVTSIRDPGTPGAAVAEYRRAWRAGELAGPRLYACGLPIEGDPPTFGGAMVVSTATLARKVAQAQIEEGVDCLKVYNTLSREALAEVVAVGTRHAIPVVGHVPTAVDIEDSGLSGVEHLTGLPPPLDEREARAQGLSGWLSRFAQLDEDRIRHYARASKAADIGHTPTLVLWHEMNASVADLGWARRPEHQLMPRFVREVLWSEAAFPPYYRLDEAGRAELHGMLTRTATVVMALARHEVPIFAGSDAPALVVPGQGLWRELALLRTVGLSLEQVFVAATVAPGDRLAPGKLGRIREGAYADVVLYAADPVTDLLQLASLEEVVVAGRRYERAELDSMIERSLEHYDGWFVSMVWRAISERVIQTMNEKL